MGDDAHFALYVDRIFICKQIPIQRTFGKITRKHVSQLLRSRSRTPHLSFRSCCSTEIQTSMLVIAVSFFVLNSPVRATSSVCMARFVWHRSLRLTLLFI